MIQGIIGKKIGMTQLFTDDGAVIPVTVIKAGPCLVVQKKDKEKNSHIKVQIGLVEEYRVKHVTKPMAGHFAKAQVPPTRVLKEFKVSKDDVKVGDMIKLDIFAELEKVDITGTIKGRGFQGVVKRWGFAGGRGSHGSMFHRRPGSIGMSSYPSRVIRGKKLPGQMGNKQKTIKGLKVVKLDLEKNLLLVKGAIPGCNGNYVFINKVSFKRG